MKKLWHKNLPAGKAGWDLNSQVEFFETKDDLLLDQKMVIFDIYGSLAHAMMLEKIGLLSKAELTQLQHGLQKIKKEYELGKFILKFGDEDVHTKIEDELIKKVGHVGKKIHTGRSRNDQVATMLRLYTKDHLLNIVQEVILLASSFQEFANKFEFDPMPGHTHMQKAMPSSIGMWAGSFAQSLLDDLSSIKHTYEFINVSPLGSAAGFGFPLQLDREYTANLLGFKKVQKNSLYCQNGRGKFDAVVIASLLQVFMTINKFSSDILLFTMDEFKYFSVSKELCSGSSIMPQKKNLDLAELLRSKVHLMLASYTHVVSTSSNLMSGYNRDLQDTKETLVKSLELTLQSLQMTNLLINNIMPLRKNLEKAMSKELLATHHTATLVMKGMSFRDAYQKVGTNLSKLNSYTPEILTHSKHIGGTGNLGLREMKDEIKKEQITWEKEKGSFKSVLKKLLKGGE